MTVNKEIIYYTCNTHPPEIDLVCRENLLTVGLPIVSVSLNRRLDFGHLQITTQGERGALMLHQQIVAGLYYSDAEVVYLCENDVLYHPSHFEFTPPHRDVFYYNTHVYKRWVSDGHTVWTDDLQQISGLCGYRELLLEFFERRMREIEKHGDNRHYEPGERYGCKTENYMARSPNLDLRHGKNWTRSHRQAEEFRNRKYAKGFRVVMHVPYWDEVFVQNGVMQ